MWYAGQNKKHLAELVNRHMTSKGIKSRDLAKRLDGAAGYSRTTILTRISALRNQGNIYRPNEFAAWSSRPYLPARNPTRYLLLTSHILHAMKVPEESEIITLIREFDDSFVYPPPTGDERPVAAPAADTQHSDMPSLDQKIALLSPAQQHLTEMYVDALLGLSE